MRPTPPTPNQPNDRRKFVFGTAAGAAAVGLQWLVPSSAEAVSPALTFDDIPGTGDVKVLNYALALEALEADLYVQAYQRLTDGGTNASGTVIEGLGLGQDEIDVKYIKEFANVEKQHRDFINTALGSASLLASAPFNTAKFNFGIESKSRQEVLTLVLTAEQLGVQAYLGAIPFFTDKAYLQTAAAIQGTEARHTATISGILNALFGVGLSTAPLSTDNNGIDQPLVPNVVLRRVSPFIVLS